MADISNYGLIGVSPSLQFGKKGLNLLTSSTTGVFDFSNGGGQTGALVVPYGTTGQEPAYATTKGGVRLNITTGSMEYSDGTAWIALATGGAAVTAVSVATANGLAGSSSGGTTPTLTLTTTVTGILKGNGTAISSATPGTDYLTVLSGDVTTSGNVATLATVNTNVGTFGSSTSIPTFTVNGKGLITAASGNAVIAPAGTLTGTTLASNVVTSSLTSVGTITSGTWNGSTVDIAYGGTGQVTKQAAFDALAPTSAAGDIIYFNGTNNVALPAGTDGQALVLGSGEPTWANVVNSVTGSTGITASPTSGAVGLTLSTNLVALSGLTSTPGFVVETSAGVFTTRSITGTAGDIVVTYGDGVTSSPTINLAAVTQGSGSNFVKITLDGFGRVTGNTAVSQSDLTGLLGTYYLPETGGSVSGNITMTGGATVTGLPTPVSSSDAANKGYVDSAVNGLSWKEAVQIATTANITLSGEQTIDGITTSASRVLVKNQTDQTTNGIYVSAAGAWSRSTDANTGLELQGAAVFVEEGTTQANAGWVQTTDPVTLGTSNIVWSQFSGAGSYVAGTGLTLIGNTFAVNYGAGIESLPSGEVGIDLYSSVGALLLTTDGSTQNPIQGSKLALLLAASGGLTQDTTGLYIPASGVTNTMLANSAITLDADSGTGTVSLGGTLTINGTSGKIDTSISGSDISITIDAGYLGQSSITTLGTISTGTWHGSVIGTTYGGTGLNTSGATDGQLLIGNGVSGFTLATITAGTGISVTNGAGSITVANTGVTTFSGGTTGLTPSTATPGDIVLGGTLVVANGGTGQVSFTSGEILYGNGTSALATSSNFSFDGTSTLTLSGANSLAIDGANGSITAGATNGDITLNPNGTGVVVIGPTGAGGFIASDAAFSLTVTGDVGLTLGTTTSGNISLIFGATTDYLTIKATGTGSISASQYATNVTGVPDAIPNVQYVTNAIAAAVATGSVQTVSTAFTLAAGDSTTAIGTVLANSGMNVLSVRIVFTTADATASLTVGDSSDGVTAFMLNTENDPSTTGLYIAQDYAALASGATINLYATGAAGTGVGSVIVEYQA